MGLGSHKLTRMGRPNNKYRSNTTNNNHYVDIHCLHVFRPWQLFHPLNKHEICSIPLSLFNSSSLSLSLSFPPHHFSHFLSLVGSLCPKLLIILKNQRNMRQSLLPLTMKIMYVCCSYSTNKRYRVTATTETHWLQ